MHLRGFRGWVAVLTAVAFLALTGGEGFWHRHAHAHHEGKDRDCAFCQFVQEKASTAQVVPTVVLGPSAVVSATLPLPIPSITESILLSPLGRSPPQAS